MYVASYVNHPESAVVASAKEENKQKYLSAAKFGHANFISFCIIWWGTWSWCLMFLHRLVDQLFIALHRIYSHVLLWKKVCLAFSVVRAINLSLSPLWITCTLTSRDKYWWWTWPSLCFFGLSNSWVFVFNFDFHFFVIFWWGHDDD